MATEDTLLWEHRNIGIGQQVEYPGHPLVLACMIMDRYASFEDATRRDHGDYGNTFSDQFIPGAGCAVHAALDSLKQGLAGGLEAAQQVADLYWDNWLRQSAANGESFRRGKAQAEHIKDSFVARLNTWGTPNEPSNPYRTSSPADKTDPAMTMTASKSNPTANGKRSRSRQRKTH